MSSLIDDYSKDDWKNKAYDIRFEFVNEFGDYQEMRSRSNWYHEMGSLVELGHLFNLFLKQLTYPRENDLIFMEAINEDEYAFLQDALDEYRNRASQEGSRE